MVFSLKSAVKPSKRSRVLVRKETTAAYLFLLPSLIFFLGFVIFPIVLCVWTSFFDSTMNSADVFVGLANYKELFQDKVFLGALKNTLIIVVVSVPITCVFSLWVSSVIVDLKGWATSLFRIIFYLPVVTGSVAVTVVWKWMFNNYYGIFNYLGTKTGIIDQNINWLGDERYALGCILGGSSKCRWSYKPSGFLEDQVATDYADHIIYCCYYNDQQFPVFCTDPAADIRWTKPQYRHDHVLHLLFRI